MDLIIIAALGIGLVIIIFVISYTSQQAKKKRILQLKTLASNTGSKFSTDPGPLFINKLKDLYLFERGRNFSLQNVISGKRDEVSYAVCDFHYTTGGQKISTSHSRNLIIFESQKLDLPFFVLRPENIVDRIESSFFGLQDIDFKTYPTFSKLYLLRGVEEDQIVRIFVDKVIQFFEKHQGIYAEGKGKKLVFYRENDPDLLTPEKIPAFLEKGFEMLRLIKAQDQG